MDRVGRCWCGELSGPSSAAKSTESFQSPQLRAFVRSESNVRAVRNIVRGIIDYGVRGAKLSYSQFGEDIIAHFALESLGIRHPRYIDIGANQPFTGSNTALFHESGSRGINIEPDPLLFAAFRKFRKRDINLNVGVLDHSGESDFYVLSFRDMSTFSKSEAEARTRKFNAQIVRIVKVKVLALNEILAEYAAPSPPHFMSIDAEDADELILRAFDFDSWSPEVICCETLSFSSTTNWEKNESLIRFLESKGYFVLADTWLNTVFVLERAWKTAMPESLSDTRNARLVARGKRRQPESDKQRPERPQSRGRTGEEPAGPS
jgi:FkbM family methyltransferase